MMVIGNPEWLKLTLEKALDPDLPICDSHHHLFTHPDGRYLPEDFMQDIEGGQRIVRTVYIECMSAYREESPEEMRPVGETEFVHTIAAGSSQGKYGRTAIAAGIVGFADLTLGKAVGPVLEAHIMAGKGYFRGIRHSSYWDPDPGISSRRKSPRGLLLYPEFQEGFSCLQRYGLSFDAGVYFHQLGELVELARTFPGVPIILDHTGGPVHTGPYTGKREEVISEWKRGMLELAAFPNVVVKLGGLGLPHCGFGWDERVTPPGSAELAERMSPYYLWCIEQFGVQRCMFESDFPVDKRSYSYTVLWNAFKRICKDFSLTERAALFHDTAARIYRLAGS
jgi:predicted TIM-barrel fold metal-dependent hydrolase